MKWHQEKIIQCLTAAFDNFNFQYQSPHATYITLHQKPVRLLLGRLWSYIKVKYSGVKFEFSPSQKNTFHNSLTTLNKYDNCLHVFQCLSALLRSLLNAWVITLGYIFLLVNYFSLSKANCNYYLSKDLSVECSLVQSVLPISEQCRVFPCEFHLYLS